MISWKRTLRTTSSERFLAQREGKDVAAVDIHYLASGIVAGTFILLKDAGWKESDVPALLDLQDSPSIQKTVGTRGFPTACRGQYLAASSLKGRDR